MAEFHQKLRSGLLFPLNKFKHTLYSLSDTVYGTCWAIHSQIPNFFAFALSMHTLCKLSSL